MTSPIVSVLIPAYNCEKYISECLNSVLSQTYKLFEIIIIDDGSTDNTPQICDTFAEQFSCIQVYHTLNAGVSHARNVGINHAKGDWIIFLDSDDYWSTTDALATLVNNALNFEADIVRGEYFYVDHVGTPLSTNSRLDKSGYALRLLDTYEFITGAINEEFFSCLCLIRFSLIKQIRFDEDMVFLEDMKFLLYLLKRPLKCIYLPLPFYAYRVIETSASSSPNPRKFLNSFSICNIFKNLANSETDNRLREYYRNRATLTFYWTLQTIAENFSFKDFKSFINIHHIKSLKVSLSKLSADKRNSLRINSLLSLPLGISFRILRNYYKYVTKRN